MKLIRFSIAGLPNAFFGVVVRDQTVPFTALQSKTGQLLPSRWPLRESLEKYHELNMTWRY
ncbi:MAG: hypothetical protein ABFD82_07100 [Syntrophaceae bacterium]